MRPARQTHPFFGTHLTVDRQFQRVDSETCRGMISIGNTNMSEQTQTDALVAETYEHMRRLAASYLQLESTTVTLLQRS